MSSAPVLRPLERPEGAAARMAREAALIAGRLAPLLGEGPPDAAFLRAMHETPGGEGRGRRAGAQPFGPPAAALFSSPVEPARLALAGLDEWLASPAPARAAAALAERAPCTILVTADAQTVAQARALALCRHAGSAATGLALPAEHGKELERTIGVVALAAGRVPV